MLMLIAVSVHAGNQFCGHIPEQSAGIWHKVTSLQSGQQMLTNVTHFKNACFLSRQQHFSAAAHSILQSG